MKLLSLVLVATTSIACGDNDAGPPDAPTGPQSILATAQATPSLSTLVAAVEFASEDGDLVNLLAEPGTLTVFAPTNEAFDALAVELTGLPGARGPDLLADANRPLLRSVLQYHVLTTTVTAAEIPFGRAITSAEGSIFKIDAGTPPVITDGRNRTSQIVTTDLEATNGVIHVIDSVLLPADQNLVEAAMSLSADKPFELTILIQAVTAANLGGTLTGTDPLTVFVPTDEAFAALLTELGTSQAALLANLPLLVEVLTYHVVPGRVLAAELPIGEPIRTVQTEAFVIDDELTITDARGRTANIVATDTFATNGVIHVIDRVLLPAP